MSMMRVCRLCGTTHKRHSAATALLHAGVDPVTIALWMGHESLRSTQPYIHADLKLKEKALARTSPPTTKTGRYRPPDKLLAFLEGRNRACLVAASRPTYASD
jgi:Phage integrase family